MNEQRYKKEHLQDYTGILTGEESNGNFKMELKIEDNPVFERWTEKNKSSIELEFDHSLGRSTSFFHNIHSCENKSQNEQCPECKKWIGIYDQFASNISHLQLGDTFRIMAALINNDQSVLPREIIDFKSYPPLLVACEEYRLRLADTPEGINKKYELKEQRLQRERESEEKRKKDENKAKWENRWNKFEQYLDKRKNIQKFLLGYLVGGLTVLIPLLIMIFKSCSTP